MKLREKIENMPECSGIYIMKDAYNNIIYVGKSINLRSRVKTYFRENINRSRKIERMVKSIEDIDYITTDTELDALILECDYIHEIRPMYNTLMNNYEKYKYIKLDINSLNLIDVVDDKDENGIYFGPFSMNKRLYHLREFLLEYFRLPTCSTKTRCIRYDIKKCIGTCRRNKKEYYKEVYDTLNNTFKGEEMLINDLEELMKKESLNLNFEKALELKNNMELIKSLSNRQHALNILNNNSKLLLWIEIDTKKYKIYFINGITVEYSEILNLDEFSNEIKKKLTDKVDKLKNTKVKKLYYDKSYIDYMNIIYSYIYKNKNINYMEI